ncbi:MAG TPA: hypothetical protein VGL89_18660 [Candidatus Koribacter sp.]
MDPKQPDRWRGERMKLWGVLIITVLIVAFLYAHHFWMQGHAR